MNMQVLYGAKRFDVAGIAVAFEQVALVYQHTLQVHFGVRDLGDEAYFGHRAQGHPGLAFRGGGVRTQQEFEAVVTHLHAVQASSRMPCSAAWRSADRMALPSSMAMVIGPTPPGTGVIQPARSRAAP